MKIGSHKIIFISIFIIIIYLIFIMLSDITIFYSNLNRIKIEYVALSILVSSGGYLLRAIRWKHMLGELGINISIKSSILIYFTGYAYFLTPGRIGEVVRSQYLKDRHNIQVKQSAATVIVERFYDMVGIVIVAAATSAFIFDLISIYLAISIIIVSYALIYEKKILQNLIKKFSKIRFINKFTDIIEESFNLIFTLLRPKTSIISTSLTIGSWILESIGVFVIFYSFGLEIGLVETIFIFVLSTLVGSVTLLPGGVGATDGSIIGLLLLHGLDYNELLLPVLVARFLMIWYPLVIGITANILVKKRPEQC